MVDKIAAKVDGAQQGQIVSRWDAAVPLVALHETYWSGLYFMLRFCNYGGAHSSIDFLLSNVLFMRRMASHTHKYFGSSHWEFSLNGVELAWLCFIGEWLLRLRNAGRVLITSHAFPCRCKTEIRRGKGGGLAKVAWWVWFCLSPLNPKSSSFLATNSFVSSRSFQCRI